MSNSNSKHSQGKSMNHIKQVQEPTKDNHQTMTRVIVCSSERTDHFHTQWASSITTAHTRLHKSGFSRASLHLVWDRASGDMSGTRKATLSSKEFYAHDAALSWAAEDDHSTGHHFSSDSWPDLSSEQYMETRWWHNFCSYHRPDHACGRRGKEVSESRHFRWSQLANKQRHPFHWAPHKLLASARSSASGMIVLAAIRCSIHRRSKIWEEQVLAFKNGLIYS